MGQAVTATMAGEVDKAGGKSGVLGKAFAGVAAAAVGVFAGAKLLGGFLAEAQESKTVAKQTAAVLKSTGAAARVSAGDVDALATALSKKSGIDDEVIASGENVLLTFTKVRNEAGKNNDIFNQGSKIALDMSRALGTDLQGSVIQVGKALNDPIKGISALQRVGVSFTEQQKEQIKALVKSGDVLGAQKVILGELNTEFGGAAEAAATSGDKLKVAWGNVQEQLGLLLLPVFEKVAGFLSDVLPKAADFTQTAVHKIGEVFTDVFPKVRDALVPVWNWIREVFPKVRDIVLGALSDAWDWIESVWPKVRDTVLGVLKAIVDWVRLNWDNIRDILVGVFAALKTSVQWVIDHQPILIGVLSALGVGLAAVAVSYAAAGAAAVAAGIAAAAAWIAAAAIPIAIGVAIAAVVAGFVYLYQNFEGFRNVVDTVVDAVVAAGKWLVEAWGKYADDVGRVLADIGRVTATIFMGIVDVVRVAIDVIGSIISGGIAAFKVAWGPITWLFDFFHDYVYTPLIAYYTLLFDIAVAIVKAGVTTVMAAWGAIQAVFDFFRDHIYNPVITLATDLKTVVVRVFSDIVDGVTNGWYALVGIYTFLRDNIIAPIKGAVNDVWTFMTSTFGKIVDGVQAAWDRLAGVVKTPINLVIGFYNDGIRGVWNNVISKIPGIGDLPAVTRLNSGGPVPGSGNRDTVPAMLTPGEFVVTKDAARKWGPKVLALLNQGPGGSVDPAVFGYATGGPVMSIEQTQAWAHRQAGKPYVFPLTGPDAYDCSGFTSALINFVLGKANPYTRRHSSGSVGSDPALQRGDGDPKRGLLIGARAPYMTNSVGADVGHTTATIAGMFAEATPPAVRVGGDARGAAALPERYFMPGFGGPNEEEQGIIDKLTSLLSTHLPDLGGPPIGDLLTKMFTDFPRMVFDFLAKQMPQVIFDAVKDAAISVFKLVTPFANGGTTRPGPIIVGEHGPEAMWANGGEYIDAHPGGGGGPLLQVGALFGDGEFKRMVREEIANMDFERRAAPASRR